MTTPREIIADFVRRRAIPCPSDEDADAIYFDSGHARELIEALTASGFHILSDAELQARDDAVLEKAALRLESTRSALGPIAASAIRAMQGGKP